VANLLFVNHSDRLVGPSHSLLKLLKYLRADHKVTVVMPSTGELSRALEQEGIRWYVPRFRYRYLYALTWSIWRREFDLVYGNNFSGASWLALIAAKLVGRPFVWHIREMFSTDGKPAKFQRVRYADAVIAVSKASARSVKRYVPEKDVTVVYNGAEVEDFGIARTEARSYVHSVLGIAEGSALVTNVGNVCARKNQLDAVEAAAGVIRDYPSATFCFLGRLQEPDYIARLKTRAAQLGIPDSVYLLGFQDNLATYLRGSDLALHTAAWDPHPRAVIEAMAAKLPVVAYDVDGVSETVVSGQTGYLVPFGDVSGLTQAVGELTANPSLRQQMGIRGQERVEAMFTAEKTAHQVGTVIDRVLRGQAR
jgi:glycosyltransferase involved in cell wall biosynthesis